MDTTRPARPHDLGGTDCGVRQPAPVPDAGLIACWPTSRRGARGYCYWLSVVTLSR